MKILKLLAGSARTVCIILVMGIIYLWLYQVVRSTWHTYCGKYPVGDCSVYTDSTQGLPSGNIREAQADTGK